MSDNEEREEQKLPYSNAGTREDPILRSEYNARKKMCPKCLKSYAAKRNTFLREDLAAIGAGAGLGGLYASLPGAAVGGICGFAAYLFEPVRYTCIFCGASFLVNKWL